MAYSRRAGGNGGTGPTSRPAAMRTGENRSRGTTSATSLQWSSITMETAGGPGRKPGQPVGAAWNMAHGPSWVWM